MVVFIITAAKEEVRTGSKKSGKIDIERRSAWTVGLNKHMTFDGRYFIKITL